MKQLIKANQGVITEGRWDIDYHLPAEKILEYPESRRVPISKLATVSKMSRDPSLQPEETFLYVDIASIDIMTGSIINPQELTGGEAPSRARMIINTNDVIVSTVRPTRGATAVIPPELDNQICSTGFCVLKCKKGVNPYYIQFILRTEATLEQFRKFATGSSYPAILDTDVLKTIVAYATPEEQSSIEQQVRAALEKRNEFLRQAREEMDSATSYSQNLLRRPLNGSPPVEPSITQNKLL